MASGKSDRQVLAETASALSNVAAPKLTFDSPAASVKPQVKLHALSSNDAFAATVAASAAAQSAEVDSLKENVTSNLEIAAAAAAAKKNSSVLSVFGDWINHTKKIHDDFTTAQPYEHVIIPDFLSETVCEQLVAEFPDPGNAQKQQHHWHQYDNPVEMKYALNSFDGLPVASKLFEVLSSPEVMVKMRELTGIADLEADPHLHGAGLHAYPSGGKLDTHLDYGIHPITGKERRLNIILFLNKDWKPEYGGDLQLWDGEMKTCSRVMPPKYNTAIIFRTCDVSYHGLPFPLKCPADMFRRSLAIYYVSEPRPDTVKRYKAEFFPHPEQKVCDELKHLYKVRKDRRIEPEDLAKWPTWRSEGNGFW